MLSFNGTTVYIAQDQQQPLMDTATFIKTFKYAIDDQYYTKFWPILEHRQWVILDSVILGWIAVSKCKCQNILTKHGFTTPSEYDLVSGSVFTDNRINKTVTPPTRKLRKGTIIVSTETFKSLLTHLGGDYRITLRRAFLTMESIYHDYLEYTQVIKDHNTALEIRRLNERTQSTVPIISIDRSPIVGDKFVYVMTSLQAFDQCLFKIGRSNDPQKRLTAHNCSSSSDMDRMFYTHVIPTFDAVSLERVFHRLLSKYHSHQEWFRIPHIHLKRVVELIQAQQSSILSTINECVSEDVSVPNALTLDQFEGPALQPCSVVASDASSSTTISKMDSDDVGDSDEHSDDVNDDIEDMDIDTDDVNTFADANKCNLCLSDLTAGVCITCDGPLSFSSKYVSVRDMLSDVVYCEWLLTKRWFRIRPEFELVKRIYGAEQPRSTPKRRRPRWSRRT